ncbi:hypothetical protein DEO72_LG6g1265 [Vigna unguiculata]|uniref:Uncharacterized protein n=1 Tax=Vigna unguiculata TaxID=3917 RepID=A0A4D6M5B5_VIGUN|nr:hypothetical protein DEO72_LG6g1265 [Vigna unguiculata]
MAVAAANLIVKPPATTVPPSFFSPATIHVLAPPLRFTMPEIVHHSRIQPIPDLQPWATISPCWKRKSTPLMPSPPEEKRSSATIATAPATHSSSASPAAVHEPATISPEKRGVKHQVSEPLQLRNWHHFVAATPDHESELHLRFIIFPEIASTQQRFPSSHTTPPRHSCSFATEPTSHHCRRETASSSRTP